MKQDTVRGKPLRRRGFYLLPNLLTTSGLFAGFYAIIAVTQGRFENAAVAIFIAMLADSLDGRVARLTNTQTDFGVQYDTLADMVSFGVATAFLPYKWALAGLGKLGWLAAFLFVAATALRLARFNVKTAITDKRYFQGLPSTAAAGVIAGMVWCADEYAFIGPNHRVFVLLVTVGLAFAMVSNVCYYSFKDSGTKGRVPFIALLLLVVMFVCIAWDPGLVLFLIFFGYACSGPALALYRRYKKRRETK